MISRHTCRVCGMRFATLRDDAITCTTTCRQRLRRGGDLAYLTGLSKTEQKQERKYHEAMDRYRVAHKESLAATRHHRNLKRARKVESRIVTQAAE